MFHSLFRIGRRGAGSFQLIDSYVCFFAAVEKRWGAGDIAFLEITARGHVRGWVCWPRCGTFLAEQRTPFTLPLRGEEGANAYATRRVPGQLWSCKLFGKLSGWNACWTPSARGPGAIWPDSCREGVCCAAPLREIGLTVCASALRVWSVLKRAHCVCACLSRVPL